MITSTSSQRTCLSVMTSLLMSTPTEELEPVQPMECPARPCRSLPTDKVQTHYSLNLLSTLSMVQHRCLARCCLTLSREPATSHLARATFPGTSPPRPGATRRRRRALPYPRKGDDHCRQSLLCQVLAAAMIGRDRLCLGPLSEAVCPSSQALGVSGACIRPRDPCRPGTDGSYRPFTVSTPLFRIVCITLVPSGPSIHFRCKFR